MERADPLEQFGYRRVIVAVTAISTLSVFVASAVGGSPPALPGLALGSPILLHLERSLIVAAAMAGTLIFLLRGWAGYFPLKLSTSGAEYVARSAANDAIRAGDELAEALADMRSEHLGLIDSLRADVRALERRLDG